MVIERGQIADSQGGLATVSRWAVVPLLLAGFAAALPAGYYWGIAIAEGIGLTVVISLFTALLWWPVRHHKVAWIVTGAVFLLHLLVVFSVPWPPIERPNKIILIFFLIDIVAVILLSDRVERRTRADRLGDRQRR